MTSPNDFNKKLDELNKRFNLVLEGWQRNFIAHNVDPENNSNKSLFEREQTNLDKTNHDIFLLKNEIEKQAKNLETQIRNKTSFLSKIKKRNKSLLSLEDNLQDLDKGSEQMIIDYEIKYRNQILFIVLYLSGISGMFYTFYNI